MSSKSIYHYVYRITNKITRTHYYGKRSSKIEPKYDLGIKYFSSSRNKEFISDQKSNPQNYKYKIVAIFSTSEMASHREITLHEMFDVANNSSFYNQSKQTSIGFDTTGISFPKTEDWKRQHSETMTGRTLSEEHKQNIKIYGR